MTTSSQPPSRRRPLVIAAAAAVALLTVASGLAYVVVDRGADRQPKEVVIGSQSPSAAPPPAALPSDAAAASVKDRQDSLAAAPMLSLPASAALPQPVGTDVAGPPIVLPTATGGPTPGGAPVPTGYPRTKEGAVAQLAAIDEAVLSATDVDRAREVYTWAALPGAVDERAWSPEVGVRSLVERLGGRDKARQAQVSWRVVQAQIKGSVGPDFVLACVLGEMQVTAATTARAGVADCQRMVWRDGRWWIGPGAQPAYPPHAWPGSADAVRAGWREVRNA